MRIFLSYPTERRDLADRLQLTLRAEGHKVFFDKSDLPPGLSFDDRIRRALRESDLFIFLISSESIEPGSYTLSELAFAEERGLNPAGRILPVLVEAVPEDRIPASLRTVTILKPHGNLVAETVGAIARLAAIRRRRNLIRIAVALLLTVLLTAVGFVTTKQISRGKIAVQSRNPERLTRGFLSAVDSYRLEGEIHNKSSFAIKAGNPWLETDSGQVGIQVLSQAPQQYPMGIKPGDRLLWKVDFSLSQGGRSSRQLWEGQTPMSFKWRICSTIDQRQICTDWKPWQPAGEFNPKNSIVPPDSLRESAVTVRAFDNSFLVGTQKPNQLFKLSLTGSVLKKLSLEGEPVGIVEHQGELIVATSFPDRIEAFTKEALTPEWSHPIELGQQNDEGQPLSTRPDFVAATPNGIWVLTHSGAGAAGLGRLSTPSSGWQVPKYFDEIAFDLDGMALRGGSHYAWGVSTHTVPSSLYLLEPTRYVQFTGHDHDVVSCSTDLAPFGANVLLRTCGGELVEIARSGESLKIMRSLGVAPLLKGGEGTWNEEIIAPDGPIAVVASNLVLVDESYPPIRTQILLFQPPLPPRILLELEKAKTIALATTGRKAFVVFRDDEGHKDSVLLTF